MGISEAAFYNVKEKFGGMGVTELRRLRQLSEEDYRLKRLVAELSLDKEMLQDVIRKKFRVGAKTRSGRLSAGHVSYRRSTRCHLIMQSRMVYNYRSCRDDRAITRRIREIADAYTT